MIKYSDNILKGFATSLSILIAFTASTFLFNNHVTLPFLLGSSLVVGSTLLYAISPPLPSSPPMVSLTNRPLSYERPQLSLSLSLSPTIPSLSPLGSPTGLIKESERKESRRRLSVHAKQA